MKGQILLPSDNCNTGNVGILKSNASWTADFYHGNAVEFDGGDVNEIHGHIQFDNPVIMSVAGTVEAWIKLDTFPAVIFNNLDAPQSSGLLLAVNPDGSLHFGLKPETAENSLTTTEGVITVDSSYHIAGIFDPTTNVLALYVNGEKVASSNVPFSYATSVTNAKIGQLAGNNSWYWYDGVIDEVRISNIARDFETPLQSPDIVLPVNGAELLDSIVVFVWKSVENASEYNLIISYDSSFSDIIEDRIVQDTVLIKTLPQNDSTFYWKLRAKSIWNKWGENSVTRNFTMGKIGIEEVNNSSIPANISLQQNYPNPFNPSTEISFDLPSSESVKLIIYDIGGKEVERVVDERLQPGSYSVTWDAHSYPSGVYFYKLHVGDYIEAKKMILLK